jgi:hypothetical protein
MEVAMIELHKVRVRAALEPRREPYWGPAIGRGQVVGFRKIDADTGSWIARTRDESGRKIYRKLGYLTDTFSYEEARAAALKWFEGRDGGITDEVITIADACSEYVPDRCVRKGRPALTTLQSGSSVRSTKLHSVQPRSTRSELLESRRGVMGSSWARQAPIGRSPL